MTVYQWAALIDGWTYAMATIGAVLVGVLIHDWAVGPHRVPHRKLRAAAVHLQGDVPEAVTLGSDAPSSAEPQPAPGRAPGAGTQLTAGLTRLAVQGGSADSPASVEPPPAPGLRSPGAGPTPPTPSMTRHPAGHLPHRGRGEIPAGSTSRHGSLPAGPTTRVAAVAVGDPVRDADTPPQPSSTVSASPTKRPAIVADTPESTAVAGLPAPGWGSGPSDVAADGPVRGVA